MSEFVGKEIELGIALESTIGTAETTADKWVKKVSADIMARSEKIIDDSTMGVLEDSQNSRVVKKSFDGDLAGIVHADLIGYFFAQIYGDVSVTEVEAGEVYDHSFSMLQNIIHPTLSIFAKDGGVNQEVFNNGVINTLEINASVDDFVRYTANIMASEASSNSQTPSYDVERDFIGKDITVKTASTEAGLTSADAICLKDISISFDTGAISDYCFGSYSPNAIYNGKMAIEGSFTKNYTDDTFKDLFTSDTANYMQIVIAGDATLAGSNSPTVTILLNKTQIQDWSRSGGADELVTEEVSFKAFYNTADGEQSTAIVRNVTDEYVLGTV